MLSLSVFAAAASAATQSAPATVAAPPNLPITGQAERAANPPSENTRSPIVWRFVDPAVDGGQLWL
jgi:hypothetical protein